MTEKKKDIKSELQTLTEELMKLCGVEAKASVDTKDEVYEVNLETESQTGLLIGNRGETLSAIQSFLAVALKQKTGEWYKVVVNIGDWREKQEDYLKSLATQTAERARETGEPQKLYNLNSAQRRIIHMALSEEKDIQTESQGEGLERYLEVKVK